MAKVVKPFRERLHGMKRYNVGDNYPETNRARVKYLVRQGYLQEPEGQEPEPDKPKSDKPKRGKDKKGADADGDPDGQ
mgnify:CR=1 FL=1